MNLQAYHVYLPTNEGGTAPSPGLLALAAKEIGSWSTPYKIVGAIVGGAAVTAAAVAFAPIAAAAAVVEAGVLAVGGVIGTGALVAGTSAAVADYYVNNDGGHHLKLINSKDTLEQYKAFEGLGFLTDGFYIEHPQRNLELLSAKAFHEIIENEQAQEILRFVRSKVRATSIRILRKRTNSTNAGVKGNAKGVDFAADASLNDSLKTLAEFNYESPVQIESDRPFLWQHVYQELVDGLKGVSGGGGAHYTLSKIGSFSLSSELAGIIGANIEYLNDRHLEVEIRYI